MYSESKFMKVEEIILDLDLERCLIPLEMEHLVMSALFMVCSTVLKMVETIIASA